MYVEIDSNSGFCFGVVRAITKAESALKEYGGEVFSLGDIVHNRMEVLRLEHLGLRSATYDDMPSLCGRRPPLPATRQPPGTCSWLRGRLRRKWGIHFVSASCRRGSALCGLQLRCRGMSGKSPSRCCLPRRYRGNDYT